MVEWLGLAPGSPDEDLSRLRASIDLPAYSNYLALLDNCSPDIAVINPHFHLNGPVIIECLKRGIHCFAEKPIALSTNDLNNIRAELQKETALLAPMMIHRYEPWFYAAYKGLMAGMVGTVVQIQAQKSYKMGAKPKWMRDKALFGGIIPWVGAHAVDLIHWMSDGGVNLVSANQTTFGNMHQGEVESSAMLHFELANGGQAMASIDYLRPASAPTHGDDRIRIVGERGIIEVMHGKAILMNEDDKSLELSMEDQNSIFGDFINSIKTQQPARVTAQDAIAVSELCITAEEFTKK